ncbi:MAG: hypothetical protein LBI39_02865 [Puniceicoccales bacterium]|jgi:hypothetical protein|nr:hypothetical protein [Puniceicoccales bacterium]
MLRSFMRPNGVFSCGELRNSHIRDMIGAVGDPSVLSRKSYTANKSPQAQPPPPQTDKAYKVDGRAPTKAEIDTISENIGLRKEFLAAKSSVAANAADIMQMIDFLGRFSDTDEFTVKRADGSEDRIKPSDIYKRLCEILDKARTAPIIAHELIRPFGATAGPSSDVGVLLQDLKSACDFVSWYAAEGKIPHDKDLPDSDIRNATDMRTASDAMKSERRATSMVHRIATMGREIALHTKAKDVNGNKFGDVFAKCANDSCTAFMSREFPGYRFKAFTRDEAIEFRKLMVDHGLPEPPFYRVITVGGRTAYQPLSYDRETDMFTNNGRPLNREEFSQWLIEHNPKGKPISVIA